MIPRTLVPTDARPATLDAVSARRRPSILDERTLVPATLPVIPLNGHSTIPANLPLESIAARVIVPRDVNVDAIKRVEVSTLPVQPTDLDERITIPQGVAPPEELPKQLFVPEDLVEPDVFKTGEVAFLPPERPVQRALVERITGIVSILAHIVFVLVLIQLLGPHVRTREQEEIARKQITLLLPNGALKDLLEPSPPPAPVPHESVRVDPRTIRKIAPPVVQPPPPAPQPQPQPQPKKELPNAPTPQPNVSAPAPQPSTPPSKGDLPKTPLKLESPDMPVPQQGLVLPHDKSPGDAIRDAARSGRINTPAPVGGVGQLPPGTGGGGGARGTAGAGIQLLTDTEGVDFRDYLQRVYIKVKQNWFSVMPASVQLGDAGVVSLQFRIMQNGGVPDGEPVTVFGSGKEPLDRAAFSSIRASNPFPPLPSQFKGPFIELRFTYYYNTPIPVQ